MLVNLQPWESRKLALVRSEAVVQAYESDFIEIGPSYLFEIVFARTSRLVVCTLDSPNTPERKCEKLVDLLSIVSSQDLDRRIPILVKFLRLQGPV